MVVCSHSRTHEATADDILTELVFGYMQLELRILLHPALLRMECLMTRNPTLLWRLRNHRV